MTEKSKEGNKWVLHHKIGLVQDTLAESDVSWETKEEVNELLKEAGIQLHSGEVEKGLETLSRARRKLL